MKTFTPTHDDNQREKGPWLNTETKKTLIEA